MSIKEILVETIILGMVATALHVALTKVSPSGPPVAPTEMMQAAS
jgi:hypothetical protein